MSARRPPDRRSGPAIALAVLAGLAAPAPAWAGDSAEPSKGFWTGVLEKFDLKTTTGTMPAFVRATHPEPSKMTFIPTGPAPRNQAIPVKSSDEIDAAKAALDAAQAEQLSPRAPPASPATRKARPTKAAAAKPKPSS